jgi:hypothetical protein
MSAISLDVGLEFAFPEGDIALRRRRSPAISMTMPKAPMYEHCDARFGDHDVRSARQGLVVQSEIQLGVLQRGLQTKLGIGVGPSYGRHPTRSPLHIGRLQFRPHSHAELGSTRSERPAVETARARRGGTASPMTLQSNFRLDGRPAGLNS